MKSQANHHFLPSSQADFTSCWGWVGAATESITDGTVGSVSVPCRDATMNKMGEPASSHVSTVCVLIHDARFCNDIIL